MTKLTNKPKTAYSYLAKVGRVIDGDTADLEWIDLGFNVILKGERIRFNRINAPESRTKDIGEKEKGLASKAWLKERIEGKEIVIETFKNREHDAFGRYLAEVWYNGVNINEELVKLNLAHYKSY